MDNAVAVSVIVPVYNAENTISVLCSSLLSQTYDKGNFEVIFVDNGSSDASLEMLNNFALTSGLRVVVAVEAEIPGSYAARNKGVSVSQGELLVFTDADCIPSADWLSMLYDRWVKSKPESVLVGEVVLFAKDAAAPTAVELFEMVYGFNQKHNVNDKGYGVTANLTVARFFFDEVGFFNHRLKSKGDYEWCRRAALKGARLLYVGGAFVRHPARMTLGELFLKVRRVAGGQRDIAVSSHFIMSAPLTKSSASFLIRLFSKLIFILKNPVCKSWFERGKVIGVSSLVVGVKYFEKARLSLGGESERR